MLFLYLLIIHPSNNNIYFFIFYFQASSAWSQPISFPKMEDRSDSDAPLLIKLLILESGRMLLGSPSSSTNNL